MDELLHKIPLHEIASVRGGYHFRGSAQNQPSGSIPVVQAQDVLAGGGLREESLLRIEASFDPQPYSVEPGDLLFLSRGHRHRAFVMSTPPPGLIAPGYFFILRPDPLRIDPRFLAWWLNQASTQQALRGLRRGSNMPFIPLSVFREIPIQLPSLEVQRRIVRAAELRVVERELEDRLGVARDRFIDAVTLRAASARASKD